MLERHIGQKLPANLKIFIHEEDANTVHFSLPPAPANATELSDEELEKVAGGTELIAGVLVTMAAVSIGGTAAGVVRGIKQGW